MGIDTSGLDTQTMQRVIAMAQERGLPLTPQTFSGLMELANAEGGAGATTMNNDREDADDPLGRFMSKTDGTAPLPAPVASAPLHTTLPTQKPSQKNMNGLNRGLDAHATGNLNDEVLGIRRGQGPARLKSHEAEAPDARGKPIDAEDTKNTPPGMQGMNDMGLEDSSAVGGMSGGSAAMAGGGLAALIATLTKRHKPSLGQSIHLGDAMAKPAINQYEGVMTPMTTREAGMMRKGAGAERVEDKIGYTKAERRSPVTGKKRKAKKKDE